MANNKKIFTIEINGLEESIKAVDALQEKINALQKTLKEFGKNGIEIPINFDDSIKKFEKSLNTIKQKASKITLSPTSDDAEYNKLLAERQKKLEAVNRELADTKKNVEEYKQETKDLVALEKKARNETQGYANTMNGLKKQLKDLNSMKGNIEIGSEEFVEISNLIGRINKELRDLEAAQNIFSRGVGDYYNSFAEALKEIKDNAKGVTEEVEKGGETTDAFLGKYESLITKIKEKPSISLNDIIEDFSINELEQALKRIDDERRSTTGAKSIREKKELYDVIKRLSNEQKRLNDLQVQADNQLKTQHQSIINKTIYTWENVTSAAGEFEDKLYQLKTLGKENTKEYQNFFNEAVRLKKAIRQVDYEVDAMVESSKGINKMVSMTQGLTALFQGATGIGQLFGMDSENAMKGIQTMTALQGIAASLQTIQDLVNKGSAFGKMIENWGSKLLVFTGWIQAARTEWFKLLDGLKPDLPDNLNDALKKMFPTVDEFADVIKQEKELAKNQQDIIESSRKLRKEYIGIFNVIKELGGKVEGTGLNNLKEAIEGLRSLKDDKGNRKVEDDFVDNLLNKFDTLYDEVYDITDELSGGWDNFFMRFKAGFNNWLEGIGLINSSTDTTITLMGTLKKIGIGTIKGIGMALKSIPILALITLLVEAVGWFTNIISKTYDWAVGNDKLVKSLNKVQTEVDLVNKALDRYNNNLSRLKSSGLIDDVTELALQYEKLEIEILKAAQALRDFADVRNDGEALDENLTNGATWFAKSVDSIDEFRKRYMDLLKAVEAGTDETGKRGKGWWNFDIFNWFTASDAKADLGEMQIAVIKDLQYQINNLDLSKGTSAIKEFYEMLQDPMYATALGNIETLFPEQEWAQVLKERIAQVTSMYEQLDEVAKQSADAQIAEQKRIAEQTEQQLQAINSQQKRVRDNLTEAIVKERTRELEALKNAEQDELDGARQAADEMLKLKQDKAVVEELYQQEVLSIQKKYNRLELDMLKKHQKELQDAEWDITEILRRIRDNYQSARDESLDKVITQLEIERTDAIEDAIKAEQDAAKEGRDIAEVTGKLIASINVKYDKLIQKEKESYYKDLLEQYESYARAMKELELQMNSNRLGNESNDIEINYQYKQNDSNGSFNFETQYGDRIKEEAKFNQTRLKLELEYLLNKKNLDDKYAKIEKDESLNNEENRYKDALKDLEQYHKDGKANEEEYRKLIEKEEELHKQNLLIINEKYNNDLTTINNNYLNDRKSTISTSLKEEASLYDEYVNEVSDIMANVGQKENIFGIISFADSKSQIDKAKDLVKEGIAAIDDELKSLEKKRKSGQITFIDYKEAKQQLEKTKKELEKQGKAITKSLTDLIGETASAWKSLVDSWVSEVSSLLTTLNDTQMQLIDNQMAEIEHQLEIQEEAYEKAEEAAQAHKDKMDAIEDELADARGSRRQFLIDTLAAQQAAYLEDLAAQQKAEEEKEKLEKKQKALEKKRAEQEKKAKVQQAVINTYMAVSNALAVQPWFVGLALSAVAMALGMKNVSAIKSTPIYEDGGVIQGARHSQGGVKVLGGQAEVEGGEFITNRKSTAANLPLLTYINNKKREVTAEDLINFFNSGTPTVKSKIGKRFASGGQLPTTDGSEVNRVTSISDVNEGNKTYVVQVVDIINAQKDLERVQVLSGLINE